MNFMQDFIKQLFGTDVTAASVLVSFFLVFLGAAINFLIEIGQRDINSQRSPVPFSFKFLIQDNWHRISLSFLFCIVAVICAPALLSIMETSWGVPAQYSQFGTILLGWGSDYLPMKIKDKFFKAPATQ